jgi:UDP-N-acetylglucosamine--N-acetylmuramyl-(pentapeptide) pyrophosphoryl-undecaprenol N-acetylglucosamine transferase
MDVGFFCSPIGLGHATRDIAVAQLFEDLSLKFVTEGAAAKMISEHGFAVNNAYSPPSFDVQDGALQGSLKWLWRYYQYYKECKKISLGFLKNERPRLVVCDEDFASAAIAQQNKVPAILITDVLQTNFTKGLGSIIEKKMNQSMKEIIQKCDFVIMPEFGEDVDNIKRVGPIVRSTKNTREELRDKFAFNKKTITISAGGTDSGRFLIQKAVEACLRVGIDCEIVVVSGPTLKPNPLESIRELGFVSNLHEIIYASDLVISLAGKSTIDESKAYGTPGIFIPIKNHFEQEDNARQEGYSFEDIFKLESLIPKKLESKRSPVQTDGAQKASQIIMQHLR